MVVVLVKRVHHALAQLVGLAAIEVHDGSMDDTQLIVNSKLATWANGVWGYWSASQWKFNWGATIMPKGPGSSGSPARKRNGFPGFGKHG